MPICLLPKLHLTYGILMAGDRKLALKKIANFSLRKYGHPRRCC